MEASQSPGFKSLGTSEIDFKGWASISLVSESSGIVGDKNPLLKTKLLANKSNSTKVVYNFIKEALIPHVI